MGYVSNWFHNHNFQHEDIGDPRETLRTIWETVLLVILLAMLIVTVIALVSPDTAAIILGYFI